MEKGYIRLNRSFFDNEIWQAARAFNESEAWLDLIQSARFEPSVIDVGTRGISGIHQIPVAEMGTLRKVDTHVPVKAEAKRYDRHPRRRRCLDNQAAQL